MTDYEFGIEPIAETTYPHYQGTYTFNPKVTAQTVETDDKVLDEDLTINAIHYSATDNIQGGLTVQIGEI